MAVSIPSTPFNGIKSPTVYTAQPPLPSRSDIFIGFMVLSDLIREATEAMVRLGAPASWDPANSKITAADLEAYDAMVLAAEEVAAMRVMTVCDRPLVQAAQLTLHYLQLDTPAERALARRAIAHPDSITRAGQTRRSGMGWEISELIAAAFMRLDQFLALTEDMDVSTGQGPKRFSDDRREAMTL